MRSWLRMLAGLIVWAVHFFLVYAIGEFAGSAPGWRIVVAALTLAAIALNLTLLARFVRGNGGDGFAQWRTAIAAGGLVIGGIAIAWQGLPALFV